MLAQNESASTASGMIAPTPTTAIGELGMAAVSDIVRCSWGASSAGAVGLTVVGDLRADVGDEELGRGVEVEQESCGHADQGHIDDPHLWARCATLGLDVDRFQRDRRDPEIAAKVREHVREALRAGATATPTLYRLG